MGLGAGWVDVVGYRHEVVHTGVLAELLRDPDRGPRIAGALIGQDVTAVTNPRAERTADGGRGRADLVAELELTGGGRGQLAVETKVHSNGHGGQLVNTANSPDTHCVLLAVGRTGMKMDRGDTDYATEQTDSEWRFVDAADWAQLLRDVSGSAWFDEYLHALVQEAGRYEQERVRARQGSAPADDDRESIETAHVAWLSEVRRELRRRGENWWPVTTLQSGPVMPLFPEGEWKRGDTDVYLEFMGTWGGGRLLCVKCGSGEPGSLLGVRNGLQSAMNSESDSTFRQGRKPRANARSSTVVFRDLSGARPDDAAEIAIRTRSSLETLVPRVLAEPRP